MQPAAPTRTVTLPALLLLLLVAAIVLGLGIGSPTGLTGKDEYLLGLRIPLEMIQGDHWWVPFIDGEPRLKKPPFIYWLGRASFELFGPSLAAGRAITLAFALLLLGTTAALGRRLLGSLEAGLLAAAILIGMSGMASESRRLMLDVPVAALSTSAFLAFLAWQDHRRLRTLLVAAACLSAALLTKGPIALIGAGSAVLACLLTRPETRQKLRARWPSLLLGLLLAAALPAAWFLHVKTHYGAALAAAAQDELEARQLMALSPDALIGITTLALPWSFVAFLALWRHRRAPAVRLLGLWLALSLLPFLFIRTFERYLMASLVPMALLCAVGLHQGFQQWSPQRGGLPAWARRLGSLVPLALGAALGLLLWRWQLGGVWALALAGTYLLWAWWRPTPSPRHLAVSAALFWMTGWGIAFPHLGVNALPKDLLSQIGPRPVVLFDGPQPALLPIALGRPLRQTGHLTADLLPAGTLIATPEERLPALRSQLDTLGISTGPFRQYDALTSAGSGIRFARAGADRAAWLKAWEQRSPDPLKSRIVLLEVTRRP